MTVNRTWETQTLSRVYMVSSRSLEISRWERETDGDDQKNELEGEMGDGGSDTDSTRSKESLTVSVGRTLRGQPVQEWQRNFRSQANAE